MNAQEGDFVTGNIGCDRDCGMVRHIKCNPVTDG